MITFAHVSIGTGGPVSCTLCAARRRASEPEPFTVGTVRERLIEACASWAHGPGPNVSFVRFEPFLHPALPEIVRIASDLGVQRIRLRTDGGALGASQNARGALSAGVRHVELVVLAAGTEHDELTERPGLFAALKAGSRAFIETAAAQGTTVALTGFVPVCSHNVTSAAGAVAALCEAGAVAVHVDAAACRPSEHAHVIAALDTAAANGVAGFVTGLDAAVPAPWDIAPAHEIGVERL